ncbi:hypothetical protein ACIPYQ_05520 [Streptomyces sp. NPDC090045]|uniref:hypothetical protein n=1 Tax=Streptomyces sp. NPDC090045 TaxID=3365927 RepID=UPI0038257F3A
MFRSPRIAAAFLAALLATGAGAGAGASPAAADGSGDSGGITEPAFIVLTCPSCCPP